MALTDKLTAIADAIRAKTGKTDSMTLEQMPTEIEGISGGQNIAGVIEQYRVNAGKSVNAGDFVEFVHKCVAGEFTGETAYMSACKLDNNRVLVTYQDTTNSKYGTAVVLTIADGLVDVGEKVVFYKGTIEMSSVVALADSKALVLFICKPYSAYAVAQVLTIDGTTITPSFKNTQFQASSSSYTSASAIAAVALTESRVLVAYTYYNSSSKYYSYMYLLTVEGDTITISASDISSTTERDDYTCLVKLSETKVLMLYQLSSGSGRARVITVGDNSIARGTVYIFGSGTTTYISATALSDSTVIAAYNDGGNSNFGTAVALSINGTKVTVGTPIVFRSNTTNYIQISALTENTALVTYYGSAQVLTFDGTTLGFGAPVIFWESSTGGTVGTYKAVIPFSESSVLVVGVTNNIGKYANLQVDGYDITVAEESGSVVQRAVSRMYNVGIAATAGADGELVDVYVVRLPYPVTITMVNATVISSVTHLSAYDTATMTFLPDAGYAIASVSVTGCEYIWDEANGVLTLSAPTGNVTVTVEASLLFKGNYIATETTAGTELTASVECNPGDLVVAAIATRDTLTLSDGWTLVSTSEINSADTAGNGQRLSWAWKFAESAMESIVVTQASEQRLYINMVALTGATGVIDNGYSYVDDASASTITVNKPDGLVLWGLTNPVGSTGNQWTSTNDIPIVQLGTDTCARLAIGLDQTNETSVTFAPGSSGTTMIVGCLTVQGMEKFY